jgi:PAS domain S-box-containing protein
VMASVGSARVEDSLRFRALLDNTTDAVFMKDLEGRYIYINPAGAKFLGLDAAEILGKTDLEVFSRETALAIMEGDRRILVAGRTVSLEEIGTAAGVTRIYETIKGVYRDPEGRVAGLFGSSRDITERKHVERERARLEEELRRSNAELERFAYVASHDLQEPLRVVTSYVQLLARRYRGRLDQDADDFIAYAVDGANRMKQLIQDLLAYARIGSKGAQPVRVSLDEVLLHVLDSLRLQLRESGATVERGPLPTVLADPVQMEQLLQNLISNAVKFRGSEPPLIQVEARQRESEWEISVADNGIGIDPQFFERIFIVFQRLHGMSEYSGTGIGLAICKKIVERHGGRIWVESTPGRGSRFFFTLPVYNHDSAETEADQPEILECPHP